MKKKDLYCCGRRWEVRFRPTVLDSDDNASKGTTDDEQQVVEVSTKLCPDAQRTTLLHEILHSAIKTSLNEHPSEEEKCVQGQETSLYSLLRDERNRWFWEYMMEEDD